MKEIERLVLGAMFRNTLEDIALVFGDELRVLSPKAQAKMRVKMLGDRDDDPRVHAAWVACQEGEIR